MNAQQHPGRLPTLGDVAARAGVSTPTASRILNGGVRGDRVGTPEIRQRVADAARDLGYSVSRAAQATRGGRSNSVAIIVSDISDIGSAAIVSGVMDSAEEHGISVTVLASHDDAGREHQLLTRLRGERHRAVILATSRTSSAERESALDGQLRTLHDQGARVVVIGDSELDYPAVTFNNHRATRALATELVKLGHRRFAICSGPEDQITARDRAEGFAAGLRASGIDVDPGAVVHADFSRDGGHQAVLALSGQIHHLDVIAAMSDAMAVGAIAALREMGVATPGDVEVTGFDHVPLVGDLLPDFTTVHVPLKEFGAAALSIALERHSPAAHQRLELRGKTFIRGVAVD